MSYVVVVVDLVPVEGRREELVDQLRRNSERVLALRVGCRSYFIDDRGPDGPVVVLTKWDSEAALRRHLAGPTAAEVVDSLVGLLATPMVPRIVAARDTPHVPATTPRASRRPRPGASPTGP
ncbi:antibiotic biosynthesis monooxygenase [Nocardioides flavescens]|uniref:ABM domain-containing protein n=1 Tax=Nocardioides flavescens TaxID=2691959 RepID=A0A6L7EP48_9ACTN|nr:hypothetical protein [Nocardioides flavescens]